MSPFIVIPLIMLVLDQTGSMKVVEECDIKSVVVECNIPGNYTITRKMAEVELLVFNRLKVENFVSIPKELIPQLEIINVKRSPILLCLNFEVDQSVKKFVHGIFK